MADETEILWLEVRRAEAATGRRRDATPPTRRRSVLVRVSENGRRGVLATEDGDGAQLADAVRLALAHSRVAPVSPAPPPLPDTGRREGGAGLLDPEVEALEVGSALERVAALCGRGERGRLAWAVHRSVFARSGGTTRRAAATAASLSVRAGRWPGAGVAESASRSLAGLAAERTLERARRRAVEGEAAGAPPEPGLPLVLAPEVVGALLGLLGEGLAARAFEMETVFARRDLGAEVLSPRFALRDDGTDPRGFPFPFDDAGAVLAPVLHLEAGRLLTPAVDSTLSTALGLPVTHQAAGLDDSAPRHLFLETAPGEPHPDLPSSLGEGLWVGALDRLGPSGAGRGQFRAVAKAVRAIEGGRLGRPAPLLQWEDDLLRVFREVLAVGSESAVVALDRDLASAALAPEMAVAGGGRLSLLEESPRDG